jgi:hypothetical protein
MYLSKPNNIKNKFNKIGLSQGKRFNDLQQQVINSFNVANLKLLEETTMPGLGSIVEGLENSGVTVESENKKILAEMKDLENKFNTTMVEYTTNYKGYLESILNEDELIQKWKGKNVWNNGQFSYVNKFGYTRPYTPEAWENRHPTCPSKGPSPDTQSAYLSLNHGSPMGIEEPCGLEGTNIRYGGREAWLSPSGKKHWYPNGEILQSVQQNGGCPTGQTLLTNDTYNSIVSGPNMNSTSKCDSLGLNTALWLRIGKLNDELLSISKQMYDKIQQLNTIDGKVHTKMDETKKQLTTRILDLNKQREQLVGVQNKALTLEEASDENNIMVKSEYMHYLVWTLLAITLGVVAVKHVVSK